MVAGMEKNEVFAELSALYYGILSLISYYSWFGTWNHGKKWKNALELQISATFGLMSHKHSQKTRKTFF